MPTSDEEPLTVAEAAAVLGVARTTIYNWSRRSVDGLERVAGGVQRHTLTQLYEFLDAHPELYKAAAIAQRPATRARLAHRAAGSRTDLAALRVAAEAHLTAIVEAVKAAEATTRLHREQLETLMAAFDEAVQSSSGLPRDGKADAPARVAARPSRRHRRL